MCIAEKRVRFLWLIPMWWPLNNWRSDEETARIDIAYDIELCHPLPPTIRIDR
jgi:hypothetical protein